MTPFKMLISKVGDFISSGRWMLYNEFGVMLSVFCDIQGYIILLIYIFIYVEMAMTVVMVVCHVDNIDKGW